MKKVYNNFLLIVLLFSTILMFSTCGSDDDASNMVESEYKAVLTFEGDMEGYRKYATIGGGALNSYETNLIDDETGKTLSSYTLSDNNHTFKAVNKFALSRKVAYFTVYAGAGTPSSGAGPIKVTLEVYKDGKLIDTIEATGTSEPRKNAEINKSYYYKDF